MCTGSNLKFKTKNTKIRKGREETDRFRRLMSQQLSCKMRVWVRVWELSCYSFRFLHKLNYYAIIGFLNRSNVFNVYEHIQRGLMFVE